MLGDRPRQKFIALVLIAALFAFEAFNFDTTKYALQDLLGDVNFWGFTWGSILAFAFCAIDFAGLAKIFTPEEGQNEPKEVWYLMGAWLLGATMNAMMTWYAISLILARQPDLGNEMVSRAQILQVAPIFVAVLVWLTRILFIGSLSIAGEQFITQKPAAKKTSKTTTKRPSPPSTTKKPRPSATRPAVQFSPAAPPARTARVKRRPTAPAMIAKSRYE